MLPEFAIAAAMVARMDCTAGVDGIDPHSLWNRLQRLEQLDDVSALA